MARPRHEKSPGRDRARRGRRRRRRRRPSQSSRKVPNGAAVAIGARRCVSTGIEPLVTAGRLAGGQSASRRPAARAPSPRRSSTTQTAETVPPETGAGQVALQIDRPRAPRSSTGAQQCPRSSGCPGRGSAAAPVNSAPTRPERVQLMKPGAWGEDAREVEVEPVALLAYSDSGSRRARSSCPSCSRKSTARNDAVRELAQPRAELLLGGVDLGRITDSDGVGAVALHQLDQPLGRRRCWPRSSP